MKRGMVLGMLVAVGLMSITVAAFRQGEAPARVVDVEKLKDNLYMMKGGGGNSAVLITANGVIVVDTKNPGWGQPLLDKIRSVTDKPVTTIINTHTHGDHVSGNVEFPAQRGGRDACQHGDQHEEHEDADGDHAGSRARSRISSRRTTATACRSARLPIT